MIRAPVFPMTLTLAVFSIVGTAWAQDEPPPVVTIVLRPALPPVPALKYRILPDRSTLVPGNAAIFYHRAIAMVLEVERLKPPAKDRGPHEYPDQQAVADWVSGPISAIHLDQARQWLDRNRRALHEAELGARRQSCDWEFDSRSEGIQLVLNEILEMRSLARLVVLRVRVSILENKHDEALHWLQTGYAMGRHVSQGPYLIQAMVGASIGSNLSASLDDLIQSPGMPSLFWALANRPRPFIDLAPSLEGERFFLEREVPQLRELDGLPWSVEKARAFTDDLQTKLFRIAEMAVPDHPGSARLGIKDWSLKMGVAAMVAQIYPEAKRALIARGRSADEVEAMPTVQVAALHAYQKYQSYRDDLFKWAGLPSYQAYQGMNGPGNQYFSEIQREPLLVKLFTSLLPAVHSAFLSIGRIDRQLDAIQCIEAIRIFAATHQRFPARLEEIAEAPVPLDPMTGQAFEYQVEGERALLSASYPPGAPRAPAYYTIHYELKLVH